MMELEVDTNGISEEANFEVFEYDADSSAFGNERCGICMDIIIDRGVLDCCQHWFCFACIDNWATITNLCPLCQNEFLIITCVPVYDTIGSSKVEEDSLSRDDDWQLFAWMEMAAKYEVHQQQLKRIQISIRQLLVIHAIYGKYTSFEQRKTIYRVGYTDVDSFKLN
ncbi:hypothetical protein HHK36_033461 [Tetracentron sinense]|uniref:RING-type domain-containing protein n=1 Tax=Tetracentron sinense TaxID=13715 RepID=A0A834Y5S2_TETSI|nr:hypothetical protein HHK36_033461 [Tetracentron sinense]